VRTAEAQRPESPAATSALALFRCPPTSLLRGGLISRAEHNDAGMSAGRVEWTSHNLRPREIRVVPLRWLR
jgi:hypothetical protein